MSISNAPYLAPAPQGNNTGNSKVIGIIITTVSIVLIAAIIAVAVLLARSSQTSDPSPSSTGSSPSTTAKQLSITERAESGITLGKDLKAGTVNTGARQIDIYFDYACSHCNHLGNDYGTGLGEAAKAGNITLVYHPVAIMNTLFSYTGASAEFFVAENEPDKYYVFHELLHEKVMTPYMKGELNPQTDDIIAVAREAGVSETNIDKLSKELTTIEDSLLKGDSSNITPLLEKVLDTTEQFVNESITSTGSAGTPTVYIDNVKSKNWTQDIPDLINK
ncbi:MAG: thioredoxin domain-containing protein [Actinomycetaceae bacterium]|nr:thioredoxin domain-containing protein [Actinomycetaceae bacterium]